MGYIDLRDPIIKEHLQEAQNNLWLKGKPKSLYVDLKKIETKKLGMIYKEMSSLLTGRRQYEVGPTHYEREMAKNIKQVTKLKFETSVWIGSRNMDIFFPGLGGIPGPNLIGIGFKGRFRGLVIEIDGGVHHGEGKMGKDQSKYKLLHRMKIGLVTIHNRDVKSSSTVRDFLKSLNSIPRLDSRARERLWRSIYIETIVNWASDQDIKKMISANLPNVRLGAKIREKGPKTS